MIFQDVGLVLMFYYCRGVINRFSSFIVLSKMHLFTLCACLCAMQQSTIWSC